VRCSHCGGIATPVVTRRKPNLSRFSLVCASLRRRHVRNQTGRENDLPACGHPVPYRKVALALLDWLERGGYEAALRSLSGRVLAYRAIHEAKELAIGRAERELEDLEARVLSLSVKELGQLGRVFETQISRSLEGLQSLRKESLLSRVQGRGCGRRASSHAKRSRRFDRRHPGRGPLPDQPPAVRPGAAGVDQLRRA
jgi:hypothetical protein